MRGLGGARDLGRSPDNFDADSFVRYSAAIIFLSGRDCKGSEFCRDRKFTTSLPLAIHATIAAGLAAAAALSSPFSSSFQSAHSRKKSRALSRRENSLITSLIVKSKWRVEVLVPQVLSSLSLQDL